MLVYKTICNNAKTHSQTLTFKHRGIGLAQARVIPTQDSRPSGAGFVSFRRRPESRGPDLRQGDEGGRVLRHSGAGRNLEALTFVRATG